MTDSNVKWRETLDEKCEVLSIWQFVWMIAASAGVGALIGMVFTLAVLGVSFYK